MYTEHVGLKRQLSPNNCLRIGEANNWYRVTTNTTSRFIKKVSPEL